MEFPDAFTHQRLVIWAEKNEAQVYVVGPDPDLRVDQPHTVRVGLGL
jgi:hypothetical protein